MNPLNILTNLAATDTCHLKQQIYGIPTWYKYLEGHKDPLPPHKCRLVMDFSTDATNNLLSIGFAVIEIMLFVAGIVAVAFIITGGFQYVLSGGNPDQTKTAKDTVLNAVIGLVIAMLASVLVRFLAGRIS